MAGGVNQRHRIGVLPGLSGTASSTNLVGTGGRSPIPDLDANHGKQLVPLGSKQMATWNGGDSDSRSNGRDVFSASQLQNFVNRMSVIEEANKALLEEVYRLGTFVRGSQLEKKGNKTDEKRMQHELMQTIRASNDVISELTSRMRRAEEKLHIDKETRKGMAAQTKQFEQALVSIQHEFTSTKDRHTTQIGELRHQRDEMTRKHERSDRTSATLVDELRHMKTRLEIQAMDFTHLQGELRQRSKRLEEETKQALLEARFQKENNSQAEQSTLQTRQFFEVRISEVRDVMTDLRNRVGRVESDGHSQLQQVNVKLSELQSSINDQSHRRQEDIQAIERQRQEQGHSDENERMKLQAKIKHAVEEMSNKLLSKEVRLREEALQKFVDVERLMQKEDIARAKFEKEQREDNETRWALQQKLLQDELKAAKESRRAEKTKQDANNKRIGETVHVLDKKLQKEKKNLEKVLLAEITKRENQATNIVSQVDSVQEQLRVALSTLQQAIGGLQFQLTRDREQFSTEIKTKLSEEHARVGRAIADSDTRLVALSARITQQDETYDAKIAEVAASARDQQTDLMRDFQDWRESLNANVESVQEVLKELPQELRETQERVDRVKAEADTRAEVEDEARRRDAESTESRIRRIAQRADVVEAVSRDDHARVDDLQQQLATAQGTLNQLTRTITDVRNSHNVRLNSETKMRLEEASAIKREVARLRTEIQPLLWQQAAGSRQFVKREPSSLNVWGMYQCARWHDIKMRWLRLLQRARRRRRLRHAEEEQPRTPSPGLEDDYASPNVSIGGRTSIPEARNAWKSQPGTPKSPAKGSQQASKRTTPFNDGSDLHAGSQRTPESQASVRLDDDDDDEEENSRAWYNQDQVPMEFNGEHENPDDDRLTKRIDTPRRPSVLGNEADKPEQATPGTGSRRSLQRPSRTQSNRQTPTNGGPATNGQSGSQQNQRNPTP